MSDIKFSVVIPLYNKQQSIVNTILSVFKQSYQNFEIVIIDDGSTDSSVDAVKSISDERVRLINQDNQGVSAARNRGIKEAKNEWIAFLDGDDLWETNHLEEIVKMMRIFPDEKVYATSFEFSDKRKMFKHERSSPIFKIDEYFKEAIKENIMWTSIVVVHKDCFSVVKGFNEKLKYGEDLDLWYRLAQKFDIIKNTKVTAVYRVDAENRSDHKQDLYKCFEYYIDLKKTYNNSEKEYLIFLINRRLYSYIRTFNLVDFFKLFMKHKDTNILIFIYKKIVNKYNLIG